VKANLTRVIEALLFSAGGPLTEGQIIEVLPESDTDSIKASMAELKKKYDESDCAFMLVNIAGGFQLLTRPDVSTWVEKFLIGRRRKRLSRAALEVLAVVAYQQPITRGEVESVRGVDCGGVFRTLLEREMVDVRGRAGTPGNPLLYVTSNKFLEHFGIASLKDLPKLDEFRELVDRDEAKEELQRAGMMPADTPAADPVPETDTAAENDTSGREVTSDFQVEEAGEIIQSATGAPQETILDGDSLSLEAEDSPEDIQPPDQIQGETDGVTI